MKEAQVFSSSKSKSVNALEAYSRIALPGTLYELFDWGEWMWMKCGEYSQSINKIISYFLVDVTISGVDGHDVKKKYKDFLIEELGIMSLAYDVARDLFTYGNAFLSFNIPFTRTLHCPDCGASFPVEKIDYEIKSKGSYHGKCLSCRHSVEFKRRDTKKSDDFRLIRWNPRDIEIEYNQVTEDRDYYYTPGPTVTGGITAGDKIYMNKTPWKVVQAVLESKRVKFDPGKMLHLRYEGIASLKGALMGWGVPPFLAAFDQVVMLNLLKRYNEAILIDYLIPFRFLSLARGGGMDGDPLMDIDAGGFMRSVEGMIAAQRQDPSKIHSVPYPVQYQAIGGEAKQLAPTELIKFTLETLFNTLGIPQEFFVSNLQTQGPPISLRFFERQHGSLFRELDRMMSWIGDTVSARKLWESAKIKLTRLSVYEDEQTKSVKLDMLASNKVSNTTALSPFGIDYEVEIDRILEEQELYDQKMMDSQRKAQAAGELQGQMDQPLQQPGAPGGGPPPDGTAPGGTAPGGAPAGGPVGAGGQATLDSLNTQADQMAQQLLTMDASSRQSQMTELKHQNPELHALTKQKLADLEQQAKQNGLNMTRQGQLPPPQGEAPPQG